MRTHSILKFIMPKEREPVIKMPLGSAIFKIGVQEGDIPAPAESSGGWLSPLESSHGGVP